MRTSGNLANDRTVFPRGVFGFVLKRCKHVAHDSYLWEVLMARSAGDWDLQDATEHVRRGFMHDRRRRRHLDCLAAIVLFLDFKMVKTQQSPCRTFELLNTLEVVRCCKQDRVYIAMVRVFTWTRQRAFVITATSQHVQ